MSIALAPGHVDSPPPQPQRGGLVEACYEGATRDERGNEIAWRHGVHAYMRNLAGHRLLQNCSDPTTVKVEHGYTGAPHPVAANPFVIQADVTGPLVGDEAGLAMLRRDAVDMLRSVTSQAVARELWLGELTTQDPYTLPSIGNWANPTSNGGTTFVNPHLASGAGELISGGASALAALGEVEAATCDLVAGGPVLIHIPVKLLNEVAFALDRRGDLLTTAKGSIVVPDSGYSDLPDGGAPAGQSAGPWIYGSGPVLLWLEPDSAIRTTNRAAEEVDRRDNSVLVRAERDACLLFDPQTVAGCAVTP